MTLSLLLTRWTLAHRRAQRMSNVYPGRYYRVALPTVLRYARAVYKAAIREGVI